MYKERKRGILYSAIFHMLLTLLAIFGLPELLRARMPEEPMIITLELLPMTGISNVKPSEKPPEPKPSEKPREQAKPSPPVAAAQGEAPPPPEEKPEPKPKERPKEKPPEPKKEAEDKKKAKEKELEAILKAVRETAQKARQEKRPNKDDATDDNANQSKSNQYDPTLPLSISERDAIRSQIAKCWSVPAGAKDAYELVVVLRLELAQDGSVMKVALANDSKARYARDSFFRAAADSAVRAVRQCSPLKNLPPEKYAVWRDMELVFDPKEMLF